MLLSIAQVEQAALGVASNRHNICLGLTAHARKPRELPQRVAMKHRTSQILYNYWNEVRGRRLAPRRFDIEPARIAGILAETLILERMDEATYRFRLAGTRISEQFATEFRGENFLDLWSDRDRDQVSMMMARMGEQGGAGLLEIEAHTADGRTAFFEVILLPLIHTRDVVDRFLGAISCHQAPAWLGTQPLSRIELTRSEIVWPDGRPHAVAARINQTPALSPEASQGRLVRFDRRQFRVLDGGRLGNGAGDETGKY